MRGAPTKAIQELAGHVHLSTTMWYMHLSPAARPGAVQLLNTPRGARLFWRYCGDDDPRLLQVVGIVRNEL